MSDYARHEHHDFLAASQPVQCTFVTWDRYHRFVGDCRRADGNSVAAWMVEHGQALDWPRYSHGAYAAQQAKAEAAKVGLWVGSFQAPWDWRAAHADGATPLSQPPGIVSRVQLTPYRVVLAGVQTSAAQYLPLSREMTTIGSVEFNETEQRHIAARQKGRIVKMHVNYTGQTVKVYVVRTADATVTSEELIAYCERGLARFKCPTAVDFVPSLPKSTTGKVRKSELERIYG